MEMKRLPGMVPFWERFPEVAARETRVVRLPQPMGCLPAGGYAFAEFFCDEPTCDCRRVLIQVWQEKAPGQAITTINFGWETLNFYTRWMHGDEASAREIVSASLDPLNPQSNLSDGLLELFRYVIEEDPDYVARLARHYEMCKRGHKGRSRNPSRGG